MNDILKTKAHHLIDAATDDEVIQVIRLLAYIRMPAKVFAFADIYRKSLWEEMKAIEELPEFHQALESYDQ